MVSTIPLEALYKVRQIHPQFKKITSQLNKLLGIEFGYMKVFKDGSYFKIMDNLECLEEWVSKVEQSHIFCERNVTNSFDKHEFNFTLWPKVPTSIAMKIYHQHNIWNGVTGSKINDHCAELYWFTGGTNRSNWHKFFIRNKPLLIKFIEYFEKHKEILHLDDKAITQELFKFNKGFDICLPESEYVKEESPTIRKLITRINLDSKLLNKTQVNSNLSRREIEVLDMVCHGYTAKIIAQKLHVKICTIQRHIEHIKDKTNLHFKTELIDYYRKALNKVDN